MLELRVNTNYIVSACRPSPCNHCSCFRQRLLAAYPGNCSLSIGCWTDWCHDCQTGQMN